jgi:hypothetical protein
MDSMMQMDLHLEIVKGLNLEIMKMIPKATQMEKQKGFQMQNPPLCLGLEMD